MVSIPSHCMFVNWFWKRVLRRLLPCFLCPWAMFGTAAQSCRWNHRPDETARLRRKTQTSAFVFTRSSTAGSCAPAPIDLGAAIGQAYLVLFGTGIRGRSSLAAVRNRRRIPVLVVFAVDSGQFVGLDQVNIGPLPRSLKGTGHANVILTVEGNTASTVTAAFN